MPLCHKCGGIGKSECPACNGFGFYMYNGREMSCNNCNRTGKILCSKCGGPGFLPGDPHPFSIYADFDF